MLLTHPHMTAVGAMRATIQGLAAEIGWSEKAFREAFGEGLKKGMVKVDFEASFLAYTKEECLAHILSVFEQHNLKQLISYLPTQPRPTVRGDWSKQIK